MTNEGYNSSEEVSLRLNEALRAIRDRKRSVVVDGIYSIIGLLTYGERIRVDYGKDPESVLREVMLVAVKNGYEINAISGETSITGVINIDYQLKKGKFSFKQNRGIKILASEYVICDVEKSSGIYNLDREGIVDGNL
ncbi:7092_t:CDS:2 [Paraglomus brasilianum]|uniref:7092_t:CDS:1 n=1 Tax=Paraglomus brasilianum TaxID=144538 RepID=A0A9N9GZD0_9GLOM|nr:7092_t:CDS:2 [Paraglomus brasilianum]